MITIVVKDYYENDEYFIEEWEEMTIIVENSIKKGCPMQKGDYIVTKTGQTHKIEKRLFFDGIVQYWLKE